MVSLRSFLYDASFGRQGKKIEYRRDRDLHTKDKIFMQDASSGYKGWPKKSKLGVEEGTMAGLVAEDSFSSLSRDRSDVVGDILGGFSSIVDGNVLGCFDYDVDGDEEQKP